ncbi:MAG TPA: hypothetical protein GXX38_08620, partial [Clostridia bacterium]|nr:hypothetical protein [Clostridia bacterium]
MYKNYPCNPAMGEMCPPYEYMEAYSPEMDYMAPMEYEMYQPGPEAYMPEMGMEHWPHYPQMPCPPM